MGNQAQQSQELELWQVVSSSGNTRGRQTKPRRSNTQTKSDMRRRGNASNYNRTTTGNVRSTGTFRTGSEGSRRAGSPRPVDARPTGTVRAGSTGTVRTGNTRPVGAVREGNARPARPAGTVRTGNARPAGPGNIRPAGAVRTANPRARAKESAAKKKKVGHRARVSQFLAFIWIVAMCVAIGFMGKAFYQSMQKSPVVKANKTEEPSVLEDFPVIGDMEKKPQIREDFLTVSEYNRPGTKLESVKNIFVHYTANPGTSAAQNRSYFESLGQTHERAASAHFIIGYEGEIVQCIPLEEEAYAVVERNGDSISIECCYLEKDGSFTQETYDSLVEMLAWLIDKYDLEPQDILRHYDCGGKKCPLYYVDHEDAWWKLLDDVAHYTL